MKWSDLFGNDGYEIISDSKLSDSSSKHFIIYECYHFFGKPRKKIVAKCADYGQLIGWCKYLDIDIKKYVNL